MSIFARTLVSVLIMLPLLLVVLISGLDASSKKKADFAKQYPTVKGTKLDSCKTCHLSVPKLNSYGTDLKATAKVNFKKIETTDSDNDGISNINEIKGGTNPGDAKDKPAAGGKS